MIPSITQRLLFTTAAAAAVAGLGLHAGRGGQPAPQTRVQVSPAVAATPPAPANAATPGATGGAMAAMATPATAATAADFTPAFVFHGPEFTGFVTDSYRQIGDPNGSGAFYRWIHHAYARSVPRVGAAPGVAGARTLVDALDDERVRLAAIHDSDARARAEEHVARWAHRLVKTIIPHFSLQRGFEFYEVAQRGERQCLAQSVLIASLLQRAGIPTGVVMVWKSEDGEESNNGHCVAIARLADGRDILVDASDRTPFARHQGLFVSVGDQYEYVTPVYTPAAAGPAEIVGFARRANGEPLPVNAVRAMDIAFLRSQFDYYRGERAPGGIFAGDKTGPGLEASARHLRDAIRECPKNPLAVYMLGNVYERLGQRDQAREQFVLARRDYRSFGYLPDGAAEAYARAVGTQVSMASPTARR